MESYDVLQMAEQARIDPLLQGYPEFFSDKIEVRMTEEKGRCVIAACDLKAGELIIASKAIACVFSESSEFETDPTPSLVLELAKKIEKDIEVGERVYSLVAGDSFTSHQHSNEVDLARITAICSHNSFSGESFDALFPKQDNQSLSGASVSGLWIEPAYLNHSCNPNCTWFCVGDFLFMLTIRDVAQSEELVHSYADVMCTYHERKEYLEQYEFECDCARCGYFKMHPEMEEIEENYYLKISRILQTTWESAEHEAQATTEVINSIKSELDSEAIQVTAILWLPLVTVLWFFYRSQLFDKCIVYGLEAGGIGEKWYGPGHPAVTRSYMPVIKGYLVCGMQDEAEILSKHLLTSHISRFKTNKSHFIGSYKNLLTLLEIGMIFKNKV